MGISLVALRTLYDKDPAAFRDRFTEPMLVWQMPAEPRRGEFIPQITMGIAPLSSPRIRNPVAWEVRKAPGATDGMSVVTVGRSVANDITIDHKGVSRMHAFFSRDAKTGTWRINDASSRNGTWVDEVKIPTGAQLEVKDGSLVNFGKAQVQFLLPQSFLKELGL